MSRSDPTGKGKRVLVTGLRAAFALELCRQLHRAGHKVYAVDSTWTHMGRGSTSVEKAFILPPPVTRLDAFVDSLNDIVEREKIDLVIPASEEIFHIARVRDRLSGRCAWFLPPLETLKRLHDKLAFNRWVRELGMAAPRTDPIASPADLDAVLERIARGEKLVLKAAYSRFASGVLICPTSAETVRQALGEVSETRQWLAQEYVEGSHICTYALARDGELLAYSDYAIRFRINSGASMHFVCLQHAPARRFVEEFVRRTGFSGQIAFDFIETADGQLLPIECNPRATSGVHLFRNVEGLGQRLVGDGRDLVLAPAGASAQYVLGMLMWGWRKFARFRYASWTKSVLTAPDVVFSWRDPLPLYWFVRQHFYYAGLARQLGVSQPEVVTLDVEWNGEA